MGLRKIAKGPVPGRRTVGRGTGAKEPAAPAAAAPPPAPLPTGRGLPPVVRTSAPHPAWAPPRRTDRHPAHGPRGREVAHRAVRAHPVLPPLRYRPTVFDADRRPAPAREAPAPGR